MIEFRDVWYEYPQAQEEDEAPAQAMPAVRGVSFSVREGEFLCIVGHNGSGKSTIAKMMNGLFIPTKGQVRVLGMDTAKEENTLDIRRNIGLVLQNPDNQLVTTVVEEDVAFGPENLGIPSAQIRERVDQALADVRLGDFALSAPHMLSGGQKQRVAIAGVLAMRPRVMVMDEPTAMLDPQGRAEVLSTALRLRREHGLTLILITHFMEETLHADRILVMEAGQILTQGSPREVLADEDTLRAAGLEPPAALSLAGQLRGAGVNLPEGILTSEELVDALCKLKPAT